MKVISVLMVLFISASVFASEDQLTAIRAYWITSAGESSVSIVGDAAKAMYNSKRAENFSYNGIVDAKKVDGFGCVEIAKQPIYDDLRNSWLVAIIGIVPVTNEYKLYRDIQTKSHICTNLVAY